MRLASLAHDTALGIAGVHGLDSGTMGLFLTAGQGTRVSGVTCVAAPGSGFDLGLRLVCELVPLQAVADRVRSAVQLAGTAAGFEVQSITIEIADIADPADGATVREG